MYLGGIKMNEQVVEQLKRIADALETISEEGISMYMSDAELEDDMIDDDEEEDEEDSSSGVQTY
jgi:hypothetical protein